MIIIVAAILTTFALIAALSIWLVGAIFPPLPEDDEHEEGGL